MSIMSIMSIMSKQSAIGSPLAKLSDFWDKRVPRECQESAKKEIRKSKRIASLSRSLDNIITPL